MKDRTEIFEKLPVSKAVATMALPTVLSMLVMVIYNMADTFFVGQTGDPNQVAAVSLAMPVFMFFMAFGNIFGIGGSSSISRALGQQKIAKVKNICSFCFYGALGLGVILSLICYLSMDLILNSLGVSADNIVYTREYLVYMILAAPIILASHAFGNIIRSEGAAKQAMVGMMTGTVVNIILDPIFILGLDMGVRGAAIATVIGNISSLLFYLWYIMKKSHVLSVSPAKCKIKEKIMSGVLSIGIPASLSNMLMSASMIILNNVLANYGDVPVAAMGVASKANMLLVMVQMGFAMGIQPLIGYNYGARNYDRMRAIMNFSMGCTFVFGLIVTVVYFVFTESIVSVFIPNAEVISMGVKFLRALMLPGPIFGMMFVLIFSFQAMGKAVPSMILAISRQGLVFIPLLFILNGIFQLNGAVYAQPVADYVCFILSLIMFAVIKKNFQEEEADFKAGEAL